jgi:DNA-binding MarR family transcriptional regulator
LVLAKSGLWYNELGYTGMLKQILDSKNQSRALAFLLAAPERSFALSELTKRLRMRKSQLVAAMLQLTRHNMIKVVEKKRQRYYFLNGKHALISDLKRALIRGKSKYKDELFSAIGRLGKVRAAFLSGLFTGHPELPVDLLLIGKINLKRLDKFLSDCKKLMGQEINYSIMSEAEFTNRRDTFDRFIKDIFDYRHLVVIDQTRRPRKR